MKNIFFLLLSYLLSLTTYAQTKLAVVQTVKTTPVYLTRTTASNTIDQLSNNSVVYVENSNQQLLSIRFFSNTNGELTDGFIDKNSLFILENEKTADRLSFYKNYLDQYNELTQNQKEQNTTSDYSYSLLINPITEQICATKDVELLNKLLESISSIASNIDEKQEFALAELLICQPELLTDTLNKWRNINDKRTLSHHLLTGLQDYYNVSDVNSNHPAFQKHYQYYQKIKF